MSIKKLGIRAFVCTLGSTLTHICVFSKLLIATLKIVNVLFFLFFDQVILAHYKYTLYW